MPCPHPPADAVDQLPSAHGRPAQHDDRQQRFQHRPLLVGKIPSPHTEIITAQGERRSPLLKHGLGHPLSAPPDRADQRDARAVGEVDVARGVEEDQVGTGAGGDPADVGTPQGGGPAGGGRPDRLVRGHPHVAHGQRDTERHRRGERRAGVAVRGERDGGPRVEEAAGVGPGGAGGELRARKQRGHRVALAERVDVRVGEVGAVVGRRGVELDGELDAGAVRQLVGVDPGVQPLGAARREDGAGLVAVEGALLAEHVDPAGVRGAGSSIGPVTRSTYPAGSSA